MIYKSTILASTLITLLISTVPAQAGASKFYDHFEVGECEESTAGLPTNENRMKRNAVSHANAWCRGSGGVKRGGVASDYTAATEGPRPNFCRVKGTIECNN